jgi:hypothetical protein
LDISAGYASDAAVFYHDGCAVYHLFAVPEFRQAHGGYFLGGRHHRTREKQQNNDNSFLHDAS